MIFTDHAPFSFLHFSIFDFFQIGLRPYSGPCPMQLVVVMAVKKAVRAATKTFTATSIRPFFFITLNSQLSTLN